MPGAVVGEHAADGVAETAEESGGLRGVGAGGGLFIRIHGGEGQPGVIVASDVEYLAAGATSLVQRVMRWPGLDDTAQLLDVEVQQVARRGCT